MKSSGRGPLADLLSHLFESQTNPRAAVLVANAFFEALVDALVQHHCKHKGRLRRARYEAKLILLNELGVINDDRYRQLQRFRNIRNRAAHRPFFEVTAADLNFVPLPPTLEGDKWRSDSVSMRPQIFFLKISLLLGAFWNEHKTIFAPIYGEGAPLTKALGIERIE
jgi:hypothetical protein